jgi:imidazolonepropionase
MDKAPVLDDAFLVVKHGKFAAFGRQTPEALAGLHDRFTIGEVFDAQNGVVLPSWCDAHTHTVFAGSREQEFVDRMKGLSYQQIAERGGGILNSADRLRQTSEHDLYVAALERVHDMIRMGTGAIEIKSGYGLDEASELKMLRVIRRLRETLPIPVRSTFLGAHAVPREFKGDRSAYLALLTGNLFPKIASEGLADFCDIFCEQGYFSAEESREYLAAAVRHGMRPKVHAEQLSRSGGIQAGISVGAISVDHLEYASDEDIRSLAASETIPVLLPGAQLFLGLQAPPARRMIAAGNAVALSTDFNPGSSPSGNMNLAVSLASILYKMTPREAIVAATLNAAAAMGVQDTHGSIGIGKAANFIVTKPLDSVEAYPYYFGQPLIRQCFLNGRTLESLGL